MREAIPAIRRRASSSSTAAPAPTALLRQFLIDLLLAVHHGDLLLQVEGHPTRHVYELMMCVYSCSWGARSCRRGGCGLGLVYAAGTAASGFCGGSALAHHSRLYLHEKVTKWITTDQLTPGFRHHVSVLPLKPLIGLLSISFLLLILLILILIFLILQLIFAAMLHHHLTI